MRVQIAQDDEFSLDKMALKLSRRRRNLRRVVISATKRTVCFAADARRFAEKRKGRGEGIVTYVDLSRLALKKTHRSGSF